VIWKKISDKEMNPKGNFARGSLDIREREPKKAMKLLRASPAAAKGIFPLDR